MTYFFETYGCEMNIAESSAVEQLLLSRGWKKSLSTQTADLAIINTCSIRETAENRIIGRLGWFNGLKAVRECRIGAKTKLLEEAVEYVKDGPKPLTLVVMGCMAERLLKEFSKKFPFVDYVVGTFQKHLFTQIIQNIEEKNKPYSLPNSTEYIFAKTSYEEGAFSTFVPIMHGCNNFCTYCIVPYVRGRECSRKVSEILQELDFLSSKNVLEITLIGQNVNSYNSIDDNGEQVNFSKLLGIIENHLEKTSSTIQWVRFMSSHPKDFSDDVINVIANSKRICHHIHLPVQNGSTKILQKMNRRYTREDYLELVTKIKKQIPDVCLTTDIMTGFPGETEEDLEQTLELMKTVMYSSSMMYYYNPREGTVANNLEQIDEEIRKQRLQKVIDLQLEHTHIQMTKKIGSTVKVLVEGISKDNNNELLGQTEHHEKIAFTCSKEKIGSFVNVKITELSGNTFRGIIQE